MIPDQIIDFLQGPLVSFVSSREETLHPYIMSAYALMANPDRESFTFIVPKERSERLLRAFHDNGRVALAVVNPNTVESYQFKGAFKDAWECGEDQNALLDTHLEGIQAALIEGGYPEEIRQWNHWVSKPGIAISFVVEDIFHQSPGPGTGNRLSE